MAFGRTLDPERREAQKRMRREALVKRRAAQAADPVFVAAEAARKLAQKEYRHAAYVAAKARHTEAQRKGREAESKRPAAGVERVGARRPALAPAPQAVPAPASAAAAAEAVETSALPTKSNLLAFRRPK